MKAGKQYPSLTGSLLGVIKDFSAVFGVDSLTGRAQTFIKKIRQHHNSLVVLKVGPRKALVWTKEHGKRKIILWSPEGGLEERNRFDSWTRMPEAALLKKRGVRLEFAPHGELSEITHYGADEDLRRES